MGSLPLKNGLCVLCNDGILKPCIGKRDKALCRIHYHSKHRYTPEKRQEQRVYSKEQTVFLAENQFCQLRLEGCTNRATEVHHTIDREEYYLVVGTWLAACRSCHCVVTDQSGLAVAAGISKPRIANGTDR